MLLRRMYIFYSLCFFSLTLVAQNENNKHDYQWLIGYQGIGNSEYSQGQLIDFNGDSVTIFPEIIARKFNISSVSMADKDGNLVFSSNNDVVMNGNNEIMVNGDSLNANASYVVDFVQQSQLALPAPGSDSLYYLFHHEYTFVGYIQGDYVLFVVPFKLLASNIDMRYDSLNMGQGAVINKNTLVVEDSLMAGRLTAVRHGNGRDWWVIAQRLNSNKYYTILVDSQQVHEPFVQPIGPYPVMGNHSGVGQASFSPDGNQYLMYRSHSIPDERQIDLFDIDRCTGALSNPTRINVPSGGFPGGVAFSPNSRYIYYADPAGYYRIDTNQDTLTLDLLQERIDTVKFGFQAQLGPDGKIYYALGLGSTRHYAVIDNPDEENPDSVVIRQQGLELPYLNNGTIPHHPNYRLGRLAGSPCDTLTFPTDVVEVAPEAELPDIHIAPNPARAEITITGLPEKEVELTLVDISGRERLHARVRGPETQLDVQGLPAGVYVVRVAGRKPGRVVVVRE